MYYEKLTNFNEIEDITVPWTGTGMNPTGQRTHVIDRKIIKERLQNRIEELEKANTNICETATYLQHYIDRDIEHCCPSEKEILKAELEYWELRSELDSNHAKLEECERFKGSLEN